ncbi:uncharacterized protein LOC9660849 [Selaginella moellendorffii]|nr:uncharacterized protein LOC9660849 [Selaginella moellendorffii]|eukprot:XP_002982256.2 uncharacterized protein LOC9660849 [Selaginella moellendorffii]
MAMAGGAEFARVSAFTDDPFGGNPAAVCILSSEREDSWLQRVAKEFNLSETAFLVDQSRDELAEEAEYNLRWFTPKVEVDLCGHATLAAAHTLFMNHVQKTSIVFHTRSGALKARKVTGYGDAEQNPPSSLKAQGLLELDFPLALATPCSSPETTRVSNSLGISSVVWCGKTDLGDYLVELESSEQVMEIVPNFDAMLDFPGRGGVIVTSQAPSESADDFVSRFFCPKSGVLEDPVTGSAHCTLGPYWAEKLEKNSVQGYQGSERGGRVLVTVDKANGRAHLQGSAVITMAGVLLVDA